MIQNDPDSRCLAHHDRGSAMPLWALLVKETFFLGGRSLFNEPPRGRFRG